MLTKIAPSYFFIALVVAVVFLMACDDPLPEVEGGDQEEETIKKEVQKEESGDSIQEGESEERQKEERSAAEEEATTLEEVRWEEVDGRRQISTQRLSEQAREVVDDSPVPVLLPDDDLLLASAHITVGDAWYAASMSGDDHTVAINGTHRSHSAPRAGGAKEEDHRRPEGHTLSRTHGIVTLTFEEFGVAYAIDVECERPLENPLCVDDDYVISLAEGAGIAGREK